MIEFDVDTQTSTITTSDECRGVGGVPCKGEPGGGPGGGGGGGGNN